MSDENNRKPVESEPKLAWLGALLLALTLIWGFYGLAAYFLLPLLLTHHQDIQKIGQFGDVFGALNALFSAFAFAVLIFTMFLQRRELALQREELEHTRNEIRGQKEQLEAQEKTMRRQVFESGFFALLGAYQNIVATMHLGAGTSGRDCFLRHFWTLQSTYNNLGKRDNGMGVDVLNRARVRIGNEAYQGLVRVRSGSDENMMIAYLYFYFQQQSSIGHYFRTFYHIYRFIDESDLSWEEKLRFSRIIRAQLSSYELLLLFYNGLSPYGYLKFWPLANKYEIFQNLDVDLLFDPSHAKYYDGALGRETE